MNRTITAKSVLVLTMAAAIFTAGWLVGNTGPELQLMLQAEAAGGKVVDPVGVAPDRYVYYPGPEPIAPDEVRITTCGTGLPAARRGQAASCFPHRIGQWRRVPV